MPKFTQEQTAPRITTYRTRKIPLAYVDRIRLLAALDGVEMEEMFNEVVALGLPLLEQQKGVLCP